jgi:hypothetical protein
MDLVTLADVRTLLGHLPKEARAKGTWRHVEAKLKQAAANGDATELWAALQMVLTMERVEVKASGPAPDTRCGASSGVRGVYKNSRTLLLMRKAEAQKWFHKKERPGGTDSGQVFCHDGGHAGPSEAPPAVRMLWSVRRASHLKCRAPSQRNPSSAARLSTSPCDWQRNVATSSKESPAEIASSNSSSSCSLHRLALVEIRHATFPNEVRIVLGPDRGPGPPFLSSWRNGTARHSDN